MLSGRLKKAALVSLIASSIAGLTLGSIGCKSAPQSVSPADFYKGNTIDVTANVPAGGQPDRFGRALALHLPEYTGATVIVNNRRAAGGYEGVLWVDKAKPDGLTLGAWLRPGIVMENVYAEGGALDYKYDRLPFILGVGDESRPFMVAAKGPYKTLADLQARKGVKLAASTPRGGGALGTMAVGWLLDLDFKLVTGYAGQDKAVLSIEQGETDGMTTIVTNGLGFERQGRLKALFLLDTERDPLMPHVPAITELVNLTGEKRAMVEAWKKMRGGQVLWATPGVPEDRLAYLRDAFKKLRSVPQFREDINKALGYTVDDKGYLVGSEIQERIKSLAAGVNDSKPLLEKLVDRYGKR